MKIEIPVETFTGRMQDLIHMGYCFKDAMLFTLISFPPIAELLIEILMEETKHEAKDS